MKSMPMMMPSAQNAATGSSQIMIPAMIEIDNSVDEQPWPAVRHVAAMAEREGHGRDSINEKIGGEYDRQ